MTSAYKYFTGMPVKGMSPRERYDAMVQRAWAHKGVSGPLGIPRWKKASKKTMKDLGPEAVERARELAREATALEHGIEPDSEAAGLLREIQKARAENARLKSM